MKAVVSAMRPFTASGTSATVLLRVVLTVAIPHPCMVEVSLHTTSRQRAIELIGSRQWTAKQMRCRRHPCAVVPQLEMHYNSWVLVACVNNVSYIVTQIVRYIIEY